MKRLLAGALALAAMAAVTFTQNVVTDLAGRGGTGGCPTFAAPPGGSTFFVDPLQAPGGVAVDPNGKLFVSTSANCVWRLDADGLLRMGFLDSTPFRIGSGASGFADGDAAAALLNNPMKLAFDSGGNLYIADAGNHRIRKVNIAAWTITTVAGGGSLRPIDGINALDASFLFPTGVAVDPAGSVYVSDTNAKKVFKVNNGILTVFAGNGGSTYNGENIPATSAAMIPMGIAADQFGNLFIADWSNSIVRKVTPDGNITTVAGNPFNSTVLGDSGPAFGAALNKPRDVAVDASGDLFIADTDNSRIRMVDGTGIITTIAGNGTAGSGDGQLNFPTGVAVDNLGNVFIADTVNNKLRGIIVSERTYRLTLTSAGTGAGAVAGAASYIVGQFVPVSATAAAGSTFVGWSGPNAAECASGAVLMDADKSCTATFTSAPDTTPPALSGVPASFTVNTTNATGTSVTYALPTAVDPDDAAGPVTCTPPSGSIFPVGATTVTCTSADTHGNVGSASFTVTVVLVSTPISIVVTEPISVADNDTVRPSVPVLVEEPIAVADGELAAPDITPPVFAGVPSPIAIPATSVNGAVVNYTLPSATDPDDAAGPVTCAPLSGSTFPIGVTNVTCTSTDSHGNTGSTSFTVNVTVVAPVETLLVTEPILVGDGGAGVVPSLALVIQEPIAVADAVTVPLATIILVREEIRVTDDDSAVSDTTPPSIVCTSPDTLWHAADVSVACIASDSESGLANAADATFQLSTSVPAGTETSNALTATRTVCDRSGNCATAGPLGPIRIDRKAPDISLVAPVNSASFVLNQSVSAVYFCSDAGAGLAVCDGTVASGTAIPTAAIGSSAFTVKATDNVGNSVTQTVKYSIGYGVCLLYDPTKAKKSGSTYSIQLQLCDAAGHNVSSASIVVHALSVTQVSTNAPGILAESGNSNPDLDFRYDATLGGYIFTLKTAGFATGTYALTFTAGADPAVHSATFQIK